MKKFLHPLILISILPGYLQAEDGDSSNIEDKNRANLSSVEYSSAYWRQNKKYSVGAELGIFLFPISGPGMHLNYSLQKDLSFGIRYISGSFDASGLITENPFTSIDTFTIDGSITEIDVKWFPGNSFYCRLGLGQREISSDIKVSSTLDNTSIETSIKSNATAVSIGLGNIWTFDSGLYLGGEWIALSVPLSSSFSSSASSNSISNDSLRDIIQESEDTAEKLGTITSVGFATLLIGFQF